MKPWQFNGMDFQESDIGNNIGFLYIILYPNNKKYIGIKTFKQGTNWKGYTGSGIIAKRYVKKHGKMNLQRVILELYEDKNALFKAEFDLINQKNAVDDPDYLNLGNGGLSGVGHSAETRAKLSAKHKGKKLTPEHRASLSVAQKNRPPASAETRAKISASKIGKPRSQETKEKLSVANKGKKHTPESKAKISAANKGKPKSAEHRAKISASNKGKKRSPETCAKLSVARKNRPPASAKTRARISASVKKSLAEKGHHRAKPITIDGIEYPSINQATKQLRIGYQTALKRAE